MVERIEVKGVWVVGGDSGTPLAVVYEWTATKETHMSFAAQFLVTMKHYPVKTPDGLIHVQNAVGVTMGQHHVHTAKGFKLWAKGIPTEPVVDGECDCGLTEGQTKSQPRWRAYARQGR